MRVNDFAFLDSLKETVNHVKSAEAEKLSRTDPKLLELKEALSNLANYRSVLDELMPLVDENGHIKDSVYWRDLRTTLIDAAGCQERLEKDDANEADSFHTYAELYDDVIGTICLNDFMAGFIRFVFEKKAVDLSSASFLSIGCGTGIVEEHILKQYPLPYEHLTGIDLSEAMAREASNRIQARAVDFLKMEAQDSTWDISFAGLNVFQYMPHTMLEDAIRKTAELTNSGGFFFGDFITPDHVRWYPHVIEGANVISLRQPVLVEREFNTFQQSEIINISRLHDHFSVTYEGKHLRYLPSMGKVKALFEKHFSHVELYDAVSLQKVPSDGETTPSTRYLLIAGK